MLTAFFKTNKQKLSEAEEDDLGLPSYDEKDENNKSYFLPLKHRKLAYNNKQIRKIVKKHVIEVKFKRRIWPIHIPKPWQKNNLRRMLCTSNFKFVSKNAVFKFKKPLGIRPRSDSWYKKRNLIIVWDMILLDWRMISLDDYDIINVYEINNKKDEDTFIKNYKNLLKKGRNKLKILFNK